MPLDPSTVYQNSKPAEPFNPLTSFGKFAEINNALQQNKLLQLGQQEKQVNIDRDKAALAMQRYDAYQKFFAPLAADPDLTDEKIMNYALKGIHDGVFSANTASAELMNIPRTPEQRRQWAADHMIRAQSAADQMKAIYGENQAATIGDKTLLGVRQSPMFGGGLNVATTLTHGLTPSENAAPRSMIIPDGPHKGEVVTAPTSSYVDRTGHAPAPNVDVIEQELQNSMPSNNPPSVAPTENIPAGGNIGTNVNEPKLPAGAVTTAFAPGYDDLIKASQIRQKQVRDDAANAPRVITPLQKVLDLSNNGTLTGPISDRMGRIYRTLVDAKAPGVTQGLTDTADQRAEISKYMNQTIVSGDSRSDKALEIFKNANINPDLLPGAVQALAKSGIASQRGLIAKAKAMNNTIGNGLNPYLEQQFSQDFADKYDQRAIELESLPENQHLHYLNSLPNAEVPKVINAAKWLDKHGAFK